MDKDVFVSSNSSNAANPQKSNEDNFFVQSEIPDIYGIPYEPARRMNDYDNNILSKDAYKNVNDEVFKLEYKISKQEEEINQLKKEIEASYDIQDFERAGVLEGKKLVFEENLRQLMDSYNELSISSKISGSFAGIFKDRLNKIKNYIASVGNIFAEKLPSKLYDSIQVKNSLNKLENISKSVDELMSMQTPYGEALDRYEQLSKYITKANAIQSQIAKHFK